MPVEEITRFLCGDERKEKREIHMKLALHCAPFLKGMKESAMLTLPRRQSVELAQMAAAAGLSWYFLCHDGGRDMILLYRKEKYLKYLTQPRVAEFLEKQGYPARKEVDSGIYFWLYRNLAHLAGRMKQYASGEQGFPHEIGVFLGYPVEDVEGYMQNDGKNFLLVGYWKVYGEKEQALRLFASYDEAREQTVREVLAGKELVQLCVS